MSKSTQDGYHRLSTFEDFVETINCIEQIDTVKYSCKNPVESKPVYVALWSTKLNKGFGGSYVSKNTFDKLKAKYDADLVFVRTL